MCSISGILSGRPDDSLGRTARQMAETMRHRGPDGHGMYSDLHVALSQNRLAVIDLLTGGQPIENEDRSKVIVLNGEIYNYRELRRELQGLGHRFRTSSDTEVVLHGFEEWGPEVSVHLNGMFAYAIWDTQTKRLFLSRDRMGEKPLYFCRMDGAFYFASELKALAALFTSRPALSQAGLVSYFAYGFIPEPYTIYEDVWKLQKGMNFSIGTDLLAEASPYWSLSDCWGKDGGQAGGCYKEYKAQLRESLFASVRRQMVSDVPVGCFLSGGIDSSIVTAVMSRIAEETGKSVSSYSIGFSDKEFDESEKAAAVAGRYHTDHHAIRLNYDKVSQEIGKIILNYDEPFADSSAIPTYYVSKMAAQNVKVVLTGDGADELFGGYNAYGKTMLLDRFVRLPSWVRSMGSAAATAAAAVTGNNKLRGKGSRLKGLAAANPQTLWSSVRMTFTEKGLGLLLPGYAGDNPVRDQIQAEYNALQGATMADRMMYSDQRVCLDGDMLTKVDRAAMLNSLETRAPFLDVDVVKLAAKIPAPYKIRGGNKKIILKDAFRDLLPPELPAQKKQGFCVPIGHWLYGELRDELLALTEPGLVARQNVLNAQAVGAAVQAHLRKNEYYSYDEKKIWTIYVFQKWYQDVYLKVGKQG